MNELMVYVERIVKPVSAIQGRKLRMRVDLLAHLEAALDEERPRFPGDERAAIERAKQRLGEPAELTKSLQQTVPVAERLLLGRVALSDRFEPLETRLACVPGQQGAMTLGHKTALSAVATLGASPLMVSMERMMATEGMQVAHGTAFLMGTFLGWFVLLMACYRLAFEAASPAPRLDWRGTSKRVATVLALQVGLTFFLAACIDNRAATVGEVALGTTATFALVVLSLLVARRIGVARRPYDEWLALDIAE